MGIVVPSHDFSFGFFGFAGPVPKFSVRFYVTKRPATNSLGNMTEFVPVGMLTECVAHLGPFFGKSFFPLNFRNIVGFFHVESGREP